MNKQIWDSWFLSSLLQYYPMGWLLFTSKSVDFRIGIAYRKSSRWYPREWCWGCQWWRVWWWEQYDGKALNGHWMPLVNRVFSSFQTASLAHKRPHSQRGNCSAQKQFFSGSHCRSTALASLTKGPLFSSTDNAKKVLGGLEYRRQIM